MGWCLLRLKPRKKTPALQSWTRYQSERPTEATLRKWFSGSSKYGLAVVLGPVSDNLACRDFDDANSYRHWAQKCPSLAESLPTVVTGRGHHVYFRSPVRPEVIWSRLGQERRAGGALNLHGGELRFDKGCYCVAPPSIHETGHQYRWLREPFNGVPIIDPFDAGFLTPDSLLAKCDIETEETGETVEAKETVGDNKRLTEIGGDEEFLETVEEIIFRCRVNGPGQRHRVGFDLMRELKALPYFAVRTSVQAADKLEAIITVWFETWASAMSGQHRVEDTIEELFDAYDRVRFAKGDDIVRVCFDLAKAKKLPDAAAIFSSQDVRLLVGLCRELQIANGGRSFILSSRNAGELFEVKPFTALRWLKHLVRRQILELVREGTQGPNGRAHEYRFLG
jgi:hypothetical protein